MKSFMFFLITAFIGVLLMPQQTYAGPSKDECAIWLCLPTGFGQGCSGAKKAFHKRLRRGKSPLPRWNSCKVKPEIQEGGTYNESNMSHKWGNAAYIKAHKLCHEWVSKDDLRSSDVNTTRWTRGVGRHTEFCTDVEHVRAHHIKNRRCVINRKHDTRSPAFCVRTDKYLDMFLDGNKFYKTTYYSPSQRRANPVVADESSDYSLDPEVMSGLLPDMDQESLDFYIQSLESQ